jgi:hypothetical protein
MLRKLRHIGMAISAAFEAMRRPPVSNAEHDRQMAYLRQQLDEARREIEEMAARRGPLPPPMMKMSVRAWFRHCAERARTRATLLTSRSRRYDR